MLAAKRQFSISSTSVFLIQITQFFFHLAQIQIQNYYCHLTGSVLKELPTSKYFKIINNRSLKESALNSPRSVQFFRRKSCSSLSA